MNLISVAVIAVVFMLLCLASLNITISHDHPLWAFWSWMLRRRAIGLAFFHRRVSCGSFYAYIGNRHDWERVVFRGDNDVERFAWLDDVQMATCECNKYHEGATCFLFRNLSAKRALMFARTLREVTADAGVADRVEELNKILKDTEYDLSEEKTSRNEHHHVASSLVWGGACRVVHLTAAWRCPPEWCDAHGVDGVDVFLLHLVP
jgi:hypothetical protein